MRCILCVWCCMPLLLLHYFCVLVIYFYSPVLRFVVFLLWLNVLLICFCFLCLPLVLFGVVFTHTNSFLFLLYFSLCRVDCFILFSFLFFLLSGLNVTTILCFFNLLHLLGFYTLANTCFFIQPQPASSVQFSTSPSTTT